MPSRSARKASPTAWSTERRSTPGIEATLSRRLSPSTRKIGQIRSLVVSTFSRMRRRVHSALRLRRGRWTRLRRDDMGGFYHNGLETETGGEAAGAELWVRGSRRSLRSLLAMRGIRAVAEGARINAAQGEEAAKRPSGTTHD